MRCSRRPSEMFGVACEKRASFISVWSLYGEAWPSLSVLFRTGPGKLWFGLSCLARLARLARSLACLFVRLVGWLIGFFVSVSAVAVVVRVGISALVLVWICFSVCVYCFVRCFHAYTKQRMF